MALEVAGVSHAYGKVAALVDVSFSIRPGVTALLGVNGAGKSTLLSVCAGILPPRTGTVSVSSRSLYRRRERRGARRQVALMPQLASFPAALTPLDVVSYLGWLKGLPASRASARAREVLVAVGLEKRMEFPCKALSGGMQRRLALAQALVAEPEVLLLDEPSTGLDPEQRRAMVEMVRGLRGTVLLSSHVVEDVEDLASHVLVLDGGRLVFDGAVDALTQGLSGAGGRSPVEAGFFRAIGRESAA